MADYELNQILRLGALLQRDRQPRSDKSSTPKNSLFTTLVVEGKVPFEDQLQEFFKAEGHFVVRADTPAEALDMTQKHWPDLILLNKEMLGSDGLAFLPELMAEHPTAAVVVMADKPSVAEVVEAMQLGAVDYFDRPLNLKRLKKVIDIQKDLYKLLPEV